MLFLLIAGSKQSFQSGLGATATAGQAVLDSTSLWLGR